MFTEMVFVAFINDERSMVTILARLNICHIIDHINDSYINS